MSCSNTTSSRCNPCGPSDSALNEIADRSAYYARVSQYNSDSFNQVYLGAKSVAPTTDNNGNPLIEGALYFDTVNELLYAWDGAAWVSAIVGANTVTTNTPQTITGQKTFTQDILGNLTGNVTGNITGNVTGSASLNVLKSGDTMTGPLVVPSGATGSQVPRASEVVLKSGDTMTGGLVVSTNTSTDAVRITQTGTGAVLRVEDSTNPDTSPLIVTATGNVGIGTSSPTQKLDVNGNIICTGTIILPGGVLSTELIPTFIARIKGSIANINAITSITYVPNGSSADVTITLASHGLLYDDSITFVGQTGNNAALNGCWKIFSADANTFSFTISSYPASLSAAGITSSFPIRIARFLSVYDAGYGTSTPNTIQKDADGTYQINFYNSAGNANYLAFGNACNSGTASGTFSPFGYSPNFFSFRTYTIGTSTLANFSDINIQIYPSF